RVASGLLERPIAQADLRPARDWPGPAPRGAPWLPAIVSTQISWLRLPRLRPGNVPRPWTGPTRPAAAPDPRLEPMPNGTCSAAATSLCRGATDVGRAALAPSETRCRPSTAILPDAFPAAGRRAGRGTLPTGPARRPTRGSLHRLPSRMPHGLVSAPTMPADATK